MNPLRNIFRERVPLAIFMAFSIFMGIFLIAAISTGMAGAAIAIAVVYIVLSVSMNYILEYI